MSAPKQRILRSSAQGVRPAVSTREPGELYVNFPDKQLGVIDEAEEAQDLIAVRYFSDLSVYIINDAILNPLDGVLYQCIVNNGPGPFTASDWTTALDSFDKRQGGFDVDGLHVDYLGDLNTILKNSTYAVIDTSVTNDPADFTGVGLLTTSMYSSTQNGTQVLVGASSAQAYKVWQRIRSGSVWGLWSLIISPAAMPYGFVGGNPTDNVPDGWLWCDGATVSRTTYANLFAAIGVIYGNGDGATTFELPDYRGQFLRGTADGESTDPDRATRTDRGDGTDGDAVGTKQDDEFLSHAHPAAGSHSHTITTFTDESGSPPSNIVGGSGGGTQGTGSTLSSGSHSHAAVGGNETRPINVNINWMIYAGLA